MFINTLLAIVLSGLICQSECVRKVVINEVNIIDSKHYETNDHIELKQVYGKGDGMSMKGYKLIMFSCQSTSGIIDAVDVVPQGKSYTHQR